MALKKIMLFTDWYEPGFKAGGPIRSCVNFVNEMKSDYEIFIFTGDRDLNETQPYDSVTTDHWISKERGVHIYYASPVNQSFANVRRQMEQVNPDFLYLNSMYSYRFTILPSLASRFGKTHRIAVLAPRGMLKASAVKFKSGKKKTFLAMLRVSGLSRIFRYHATDAEEVQEIRRFFGDATSIFHIPNFAAPVPPYPQQPVKQPGELRMVFVGRVHPVKNLLYLLKLLPETNCGITLTIIGNIEDRNYYEQCRAVVASLPTQFSVVFKGGIPTSEVLNELHHHHVFVLPTVGENFGHSIFEALSFGKPVIISDNTPWRRLAEKKAGFDLSLEKPALFAEAIKRFCGMSDEEFREWSNGAYQFVHSTSSNNELKKKYIQLFS